MEVERALQEIEEKRQNHTFSVDDATKLLNLADQYPCNLPTQLLVIEFAHYERGFSKPWATYAKEATEKGETCWNKQELAEIYLLMAQLYFYDQDKQLQNEAIREAFRIASDNWKTLSAYLGEFWGELPPNKRLELTESISKTNPENPHAYYVQAQYFEEYASQSGEKRYRDAAIAAYKKSLDLGMDRPPYAIPSQVVKDAIERLEEIAKSE